MRELKFRTWNWLEGRFDKDPAVFITIGGELIPSNNRIIEQYTGLKDKNGKEIYEGDVVHYTEKIAPNKSSTYEVYYDQLHAMYALSPVDGKIDVGEFYGYIMRQQYEIVGNIHENPELLEGE